MLTSKGAVINKEEFYLYAYEASPNNNSIVHKAVFLSLFLPEGSWITLKFSSCDWKKRFKWRLCSNQKKRSLTKRNSIYVFARLHQNSNSIQRSRVLVIFRARRKLKPSFTLTLSSFDWKNGFKWRLCINLILGCRYSFLSLSFSRESYFPFVEAVQVGTYLKSNALLVSFVDKEVVSSAYFHSSVYQAPKKI